MLIGEIFNSITSMVTVMRSVYNDVRLFFMFLQMSLVMRKPMFCICENKDADQLRGNREADQQLCFCYIDSTIRLLSKSKISSLYPSSLAVQPGLSQIWSETRTLVFW